MKIGAMVGFTLSFLMYLCGCIWVWLNPYIALFLWIFSAIIVFMAATLLGDNDVW